MTYPEAIQYLNTLPNYEQLTAYRYGEALGLDRIESLLRGLGNPHKNFASLHVAGTKGKGSTCAFAASILQALGRRVGLYTSPHLASLRERIQVNGRPVTPERFAETVQAVMPRMPGNLTFFEATTACAFLYFARERVEDAVIEVGLGGRLDATNVIAPAVSVVAPISLDHTDKLGSSLGEIAGEKAGIIKPGTPVVVSRQPREASQVIEAAARALQAPVHRLEEEIQIEGVRVSTAGSRVSFRTPRAFYPDLLIPLLGRHQIANAALAVRAVELARPEVEVPRLLSAVREGLAETRWPGRCQLVPGSPPILLDGAQNGASAEVLVSAVRELFPGRRVIGVVGISGDKDIAGIARVWGPWMSELILTRAQAARAESPERLAEAFSQWHPRPHLAARVPDALELARGRSRPDDLMVVAGSLFLVGEALEALGRSSGGAFEASGSERGSRPGLHTLPG
ncbi:MAG: bifunctional folylpolyglutamate synthase/dihydrofolate synthase [Candidatus Omnitrophica bacterium]|nr:bifunctional folylpolyglutamate synthase/dihydrofolate synthase [Candidatus Omnitrophota bacterium]